MVRPQPRSPPTSWSSGAGRALTVGRGLGVDTPRSTVIGRSSSGKRACPWESCLSLAEGESWRGTQLTAANGLGDERRPANSKGGP